MVTAKWRPVSVNEGTDINLLGVCSWRPVVVAMTCYGVLNAADVRRLALRYLCRYCVADTAVWRYGSYLCLVVFDVSGMCRIMLV